MSNHRQTTASGPSLAPIIMMALATLSTIGVGLWITWGATDSRHLTGAGMAFVLALLLTAQTVVRASERAVALEKRAARAHRYAGLAPLGESDHVDLRTWASGGAVTSDGATVSMVVPKEMPDRLWFGRWPQEPDPVAAQPIPPQDRGPGMRLSLIRVEPWIHQPTEEIPRIQS